jgi:hypothetical protein
VCGSKPFCSVGNESSPSDNILIILPLTGC